MVTMHCGHSARTAAYPARKYSARVSFCTCKGGQAEVFTLLHSDQVAMHVIPRKTGAARSQRKC